MIISCDNNDIRNGFYSHNVIYMIGLIPPLVSIFQCFPNVGSTELTKDSDSAKDSLK